MPEIPNPLANPPPILAIIHELYQNAYVETVKDGARPRVDVKYKCPDILSLAEHLHEQILAYDVKKASMDEFNTKIANIFTSALAQTINARKNTVVYTSFVEDLTNFFFFAAIWLIEELQIPIDLKLTSRRKSLEEEMSKLLSSSIDLANRPSILTGNIPSIRDWFGLRMIFENLSPNELLTYTGILISLLVDKLNPNRIKFEKWINNSTGVYGGAYIPKELLLRILSYTFGISDEKNLVSEPTDTTYQSWHGTLTVITAPKNTNLEGFRLEIQARSYDMHINAEDGPAAHWKYEKGRRPLTDGIFRLDNYHGGIAFYSGPDKPHLDLNGLTTFAAVLYRHVSPHAVPRHSMV